MILDALLQFDAGQNFTSQPVASYASTNVLDWGNLGLPTSSATVLGVGQVRDMGIGDDPALKLLVQVSVAFTSAGAGTLAVALQGAPDTAAGLPGTFVTWWTSPTYALATLATVGARLYDMDFPRPPDGIVIPRFVRMLYTVGTAVFTAGTIQAYVVIDRMDQPYSSTNNAVMGGYPAGINVAN